MLYGHKARSTYLQLCVLNRENTTYTKWCGEELQQNQ